jgi:hypothetical protein
MSANFVSAFNVFGQRPPDPAQVRTLRDELVDIRNRVKHEADKGLPPQEIDAARGLIAAAEIAANAVEKLAA